MQIAEIPLTLVANAKGAVSKRATTPERGRNWRALYYGLLVGVGYYAAAKLGFALTFAPKPVSTFWAPNAILMGALLVSPVRRWWQLLLAALVAHLAAEINAGVPMSMVACWFISNCVEALIGAGLIRRYATHPLHFGRFANVSAFLLFGALAAPLLSSFLDAAFVTLNSFGASTYWAIWRHRWLANTLAALVTVPVIVGWHTFRLGELRAVSVRRVLEASALVVALAVISFYAFGRIASTPAPVMLYAPLPPLVWAAVRFGPRGLGSALLFVVLVTVWYAVHGRGPFVGQTSAQNALSIHLFFIVVSATLLTVAALMEERKQSEEAERRKTEQLHLALSAAQMSAWELPVRNRQQWLAESKRLLTGDTADVVLSLAGLDVTVYPADLPAVTRAIAESTRTGLPFLVEFRVIDAEGSIRWLAGRGRMLRDAAGSPIRMTGLTSDITDRKRSESLIAGENQILKMIATGEAEDEMLHRLALLVEAESPGLLCSVLLLGDDGVHVRHAAAPSLPDEYVRMIDGAAIGPRAGSCGTAMYHRKQVIVADIATDPYWDDYRAVALSFGLRACWSTPIIAGDGKVLGSLGMYYREVRRPSAEEFRLIEIACHLATIILERKHAELEAHDQRQALAHLGRVAMLGELSGAYAHELTQPLTAILSNAQAAQKMLARENPDLEEVRAILDDIVAADTHAGTVIHRLRPMLKKGQTQLLLVDLNEVVLEAQKLARSDWLARETQVVTQLQPDLPLILADRVQLLQIILNLTINACDAMSDLPREDRRLTIMTRCVNNCEDVQLSITDHGPGIGVDVFPRIFEPFFTSKKNGLGLGLSICRSIVQTHSGRLWAENNPHRGATFHLTIAAAKEFPKGHDA